MGLLKFALLLTGQPRTYRYCFPSFQKHILEPYHPDVFICVDGEEQGMRELFQPVDMHIVTPEEDKQAIGDRQSRYTKHSSEVVVWANISHVYKWKVCYSLMVNHATDYDVVLMGRPDTFFKRINFDFSVPLKENTLYLPQVDALGNGAKEDGGIYANGWGGQLCWGTMHVAEVISKMYDCADTNYELCGEWHVERVFRRHCRELGVDKASMVDIDFHLVRETNGELWYGWRGKYVPIEMMIA